MGGGGMGRGDTGSDFRVSGDRDRIDTGSCLIAESATDRTGATSLFSASVSVFTGVSGACTGSRSSAAGGGVDTVSFVGGAALDARPFGPCRTERRAAPRLGGSGAATRACRACCRVRPSTPPDQKSARFDTDVRSGPVVAILGASARRGMVVEDAPECDTERGACTRRAGSSGGSAECDAERLGVRLAGSSCVGRRTSLDDLRPCVSLPRPGGARSLSTVMPWFVGRRVRRSPSGAPQYDASTSVLAPWPKILGPKELLSHASSLSSLCTSKRRRLGA